MEHSLKQLLPMYLVIFIGFIGYSLMLTIFTPMILHAHTTMVDATAWRGHRTGLLGVLLFLYPVGQFLGSPVLGTLSDRFGRKPILVFSLALSALFYSFIAGSLMWHSLSLLMCSLFLAGLSEANVAIAQGAVSDLCKKANRARYFGYVYVAASSAYIVGPLVGGKLADSTLMPGFGYPTPFWMVFILLLTSLSWIVFSFKETHPADQRRHVHWLDSFKSIVSIATDRRLRPYYMINFLVALTLFGFFRCYPMYLVEHFQMGVSQESEFIAWVSVPIILANLWLTGFLAKRFKAKQILVVSSFLLGLSLLVMLIPQQPIALWVVLFLPSLFAAILLPAAVTLLSLQAEEAKQGSVMGNNQSLQLLAESFAGLLAGLLAALFIQLPILILAVVAFVVVVFMTRSSALKS